MKQISELLDILINNQDTLTIGENLSEESENVEVRLVSMIMTMRRVTLLMMTMMMMIWVMITGLWQLTCMLSWSAKTALLVAYRI